MGPCCMPAVQLHAVETLHATMGRLRRLNAWFARRALLVSRCKRYAMTPADWLFMRETRLISTRCGFPTHAWPNSLLYLPRGTGLHAAPCPIGLRAHHGNDCHCEKDQNASEHLIRRMVRRLPIDDADGGWFDFHVEGVGGAFDWTVDGISSIRE
jgi:hypothetical protein